MSESVRVVIRCRPFSKREKEAGHSKIVQISQAERRVTVTLPPDVTPQSNDTGERSFTFDGVFDETSTQTEVFNVTAKPLVESVLEGYNGCCFTYGQTGSGKTFSMQGLPDPPELKGIIPQTFDHIFSKISQSPDRQFLVSVSYLEIYNEEIRDLLAKEAVGGKRGLDLKESPDKGIYVKDLTIHQVKNTQDMDKIMEVGNRNRSVGATLMNETSSRSHSIFTITIESCLKQDPAAGGAEGEKQHIIVGKLHLIDLAGSERQSKTGATGDRLKEGARINLSLTALGNCISALVDGKSSHIPYRDSKLTRLLQDSLGGNSKTLMIATMSPASYNYDETIGTLRYANRAKNIKNKPVVNEDPKDAQLKQYQDEIEKLKALLQTKKVGGGSVAAGGQRRKTVAAVNANSNNNSTTAQIGNDQQPSTDAPVVDIVDDRMIKMQQEIDKEREQLLNAKGMAEVERNRIAEELNQREQELNAERQMREEVAAKLRSLESKLIVGGVDLKEHVEQQQKELEQKKKMVQTQRQKQDELRQEMEKREEVQLQLAGKYANLQEEVDVKTKKLNKLWSKLQEIKQEIAGIQDDFRNEKEDILSTIRELTKELALKEKIIENFIPTSVKQKLEQRVVFDSQERNEWITTGLPPAFTNLQKKRSSVTPEIFKMPVALQNRLKMASSGNCSLRYREQHLLEIPLFVPEHRVPEYDPRTAGAYLSNQSTEWILEDLINNGSRVQFNSTEAAAQRAQTARPHTQQQQQQFPQARNLVVEKRRFA